MSIIISTFWSYIPVTPKWCPYAYMSPMSTWKRSSPITKDINSTYLLYLDLITCRVIRQDEQTTAMQTIVFELCNLDSGTYNWYTQCLVLLRAILRRADFSFTSQLLYALLAGTDWCFCQKLTRLNWSNIIRFKRYLASFQACH